MKKIYVKAYFRNNVGDDMFVVKLASRYPEVLFRICTHKKYTAAFKDVPNIRIVPGVFYYAGRLFEKIFRKNPVVKLLSRRSDAVVRIGGSVFIEPPDGRFRPISPDAGRCFYIGANFGPCRTEGYYQSVYRELRRVEDICFRDRSSYECFRELPNARLAPDVLFGYPYPEPIPGGGIGISVLRPEERGSDILQAGAEAYYREMGKIVELCSDRGLPVRLFAFCEEEGDAAAIEKILSFCRSPERAETYIYRGDIPEFLDRWNQCGQILATRFHAMVIGWSMGKKVLPVIYSEKQSHVLDDMGFAGPVWDLLHGDASDGTALFSRFSESEDRTDVDELIRRSEEQFSALDRFLSEKKDDRGAGA